MGKANIGKLYVGLTDDPDQRRKEHGNPPTWFVAIHFEVEQRARDWEKTEISKEDHVGGPGGEGWRHGYNYTITEDTIE
jgi:hypothetical protein